MKRDKNKCFRCGSTENIVEYGYLNMPLLDKDFDELPCCKKCYYWLSPSW